MRGAGEADGEYIFELRTEGTVGCDGPCNRYIASVSHMHVCCTQRGIRCEPVVKKGGNATDSPFCQIKSGKGVFLCNRNFLLHKKCSAPGCDLAPGEKVAYATAPGARILRWQNFFLMQQNMHFSDWRKISLRRAQKGGYSWEYLKSYRQEACWHS